MELPKCVDTDEENEAKGVADSDFLIRERNERSNKSFENANTDVNKSGGPQSSVTNNFQDSYDSHEVQSSAMDPSKSVAEEFAQIPSSSKSKNLIYTGGYKKNFELFNVSASNLTTIDNRKASTSSTSALHSMSNDTRQPSFSLESPFSSVTHNMSEMLDNKMETSSKKTQRSKSKPGTRTRISPEQLAKLERHYQFTNDPGTYERIKIALEINRTVAYVAEWFKVRRRKEGHAENGLGKVKNVVRVSKEDQSNGVQILPSPSVNKENNPQSQVNAMNTTELEHRTSGYSSTCKEENVTEQENGDKFDSNPKERLTSNDHIVASASTVEVVTKKENYLSHSPLKEKPYTDQECALDLSMPKNTRN